jgi:hypothetical protein
MAADIRGIADEAFATIEAYRVTALLNQKREARGENAWGGRSDLLTAQFGSNTRFMSRFGVTFMIPRCMS